MADEADGKLLKLGEGEVLIKEGSTSSSLYWLQKGTMAVQKRRGSKDVIIGRIHSGELVGEMSFLDNEPRCATVLATSECELIEIPSEKFHAIFDAQPQWYQALIKTLLARLRRTNAMIRV